VSAALPESTGFTDMDFSWLFEPARMQFCEETLSGVIKHPADTWTNIGPIVAGIMIVIYAVRPLERLLGAAALWTGIASGYFHASNTILGETLDLSGMFMVIFCLLALQQHRAAPNLISDMTLAVWVLIASAILTILSAFWAIFASPAFGVIVVIVIIRGIRANKVGPWAWAMVGSFAVAWAFWWLDKLHILCIPGNHILTGHGIWHLLNGVVFWFAFGHYQVTADSSGVPRDDGAVPVKN
jgi:hypothetical protein